MFLNNANNTQPPLAADEFTFDTNWFDRCTDFHDQSLWKLYKKFMEILFRKKKYQPLPRYHRPVNEDQTTPHRLVFWTLIFNFPLSSLTRKVPAGSSISTTPFNSMTSILDIA